MPTLIAIMLVSILMLPPVIAAPAPSGSSTSFQAWSHWDQTTWTRYRDLDDTENELKALAEAFPSICQVYNLSEMFKRADGSPRLTVQGRTIWGLKISDNVGTNESSEPESLVIAMTHAREWIGNEVVMFCINYILRNYGYNSSIDPLVNGTEMWFVPVLNPDGFQHSLDKDDLNNSYGTSGWRKNVNESNGVSGFQDYGGGSGDGIDLNRNLGYKWGLPGSSGNANDLTYRGTAPYSEVENQVLHLLARSREFRMTLSYHSVAGLNLYPWGHSYQSAEDYRLLDAIARKMSSYNGYTPQQGSALYPTSGDFTDYFYGTYRVPSFTVELNDRDSKFIPEVGKIIEDAHKNLEVTLLMARLAHDPFSIFRSGLNATIVDMRGDPVSPSHVNVTGNGRSHILTSNGSFNLSLPDGSYSVNITGPGGLHNLTTITVAKGQYRRAAFVLKETIPPEVLKVEAFVGGTRIVSAEAGSSIRIVVSERFSEGNLTGSLEIVGPGYGTGLALSGSNGTYEATWNTSGAEPYQNYTVESSLSDICGNVDGDGAVPGPDLTLTLIDTTPPRIQRLSASTGGVEGNVFERGETIDLALEVPDEPLPVTAVLDMGGTDVPMAWAGGTAYRATVDSTSLSLGAHNWSATATDRFGNAAVSNPLVLSLVDTAPPEFTARITGPSPFRDGDIVTLLVTPMGENASLLRPEAYLFMEDEPIANITDYERDGPSFSMEWDSAGARTSVYHFEVRLYDDAGNYDPDGSQVGYDLTFRVNDLTPPVIVSVEVDGQEVSPGDPVVIHTACNITLKGESLDNGSSCSIHWVDTLGWDMGTVQMERTDDRTFSASLGKDDPGYGAFDIEFVLLDLSGNMDMDGFGDGNDLTITIERPPIVIGAPVMFDLDTEGKWSAPSMGYVLAGERVRMVCPSRNLTTEDRFSLIVDGLPSDLRVDLENDTLTSDIETSEYEGIVEFSMAINLFNGTRVETLPVKAFFGVRRSEPPTDLRLQGYYRLPDGSYIVNLTVSIPARSSSLIVRVNGSEAIEIAHGPGLIQLNVANNVTISVLALYKPFPEGGRNLTFESEEVSLRFNVEEGAGPPVAPDDPNGGSDISPYILAIGGTIVALVLIAIVLALKGRKGDTVSWED